MSEKSSPNKFSSIEEVIEYMDKFANYLANMNCTDGHWAMAFDDLKGEFMLELAHGMQRYAHLPYAQQTAIYKRMMDNRLSELRYKYFVTHRKAEVGIEDVDSEAMDSVPGGASTDSLYTSRDNVKQTLAALSPTAVDVLEAILFGNDRLDDVLSLMSKRSKTVKNIHLKIAPRHLSDALLITEKEAVKAFGEIKRVYSEVVL